MKTNSNSDSKYFSAEELIYYKLKFSSPSKNAHIHKKSKTVKQRIRYL